MNNCSKNNNNKRVLCTISQFQDYTIGKAITVAATLVDDIISKIEVISELGYALVIMGCDLLHIAKYINDKMELFLHRPAFIIGCIKSHLIDRNIFNNVPVYTNRLPDIKYLNMPAGMTLNNLFYHKQLIT